ncbi:hypothetical protein DV736_g3879, partial [Chaetothyriales sp. CBS 134916]
MSSKLQQQAAWECSIAAFFYSQLLVHAKPIPASTSLGGQTAIITGANSEQGFEVERQLLQLGLPRLIMALRPQSKGKTAASDLQKEFPQAQIEVFLIGYIVHLIIKVVGRSLRVDASVYVDAVAVEGKESHGSFVSEWTIKPYATVMYTEEGQEMRERLWQETLDELNFAGAATIVSQHGKSSTAA